MADAGQWELGWELFRLASIVQTRQPFRAAASTLRELSRRTGETSLLAVYDPARHRRMFAAAAVSEQSVRFVPDLYSWLPMHAGASALAILAFRPEKAFLRAAAKAEGGKVTYLDTCLTGVKHALEFNPFYSSGNGSTTPYYTGIVVGGLKAVNSPSGAGSVLDGYNAKHRLALTLENISLDATSTAAKYASIGRYKSNVTATGTDVTVVAITGTGTVPACVFPKFPGL